MNDAERELDALVRRSFRLAAIWLGVCASVVLSLTLGLHLTLGSPLGQMLAIFGFISMILGFWHLSAWVRWRQYRPPKR